MAEIEDWGERVFAQTVAVLDQRGRTELVQLLLDVQRFEFVFTEHDWNQDWYRLVVDIEDHLMTKFSEKVQEEIGALVCEVADRSDYNVERTIHVRMVLPEVDSNWRATFTARLNGERPTNQARKERNVPTYPSADGLWFSSREELRVYRSLVRLQQARPATDTFAICPLPGARLRENHTWSPDFLVVGNGRAVVIEIDGPHHRAQPRYVDDRNRDLQWERCGVQVARIAVEDLKDDEQLRLRLVEILRRSLQWPPA